MTTDRSDNNATHYGTNVYAPNGSGTGGAIRHTSTTVTASATAVPGRYYTVDSTAASVTMTLPTLAATDDGAEFVFWKLVAGNSMIIDGAAAETIEGAANVTTTTRYSMVIIRKAGTVWQLWKGAVNPDGITGAQIADDAIDSEHYAAGSIDLEHMSANSVDSDQYVDGSIDAIHLSANSVDSDAYVDGSIDPEHFAAAAVVGATLGGGSRVNTVDTAVSLAAADGLTIVFVSSTAGAGTRTITRTALAVGVPVLVVMTAFDTNAYTAAVLGGTVTLDAVGERVLLMWDGTNLLHLALVGATFA